jgi:hypothetical protein
MLRGLASPIGGRGGIVRTVHQQKRRGRDNGHGRILALMDADANEWVTVLSGRNNGTFNDRRAWTR